MFPIPFVVLLVLAFCLGSVPFAYLFVKKIKNIDIRTIGSGNVGATNAGRVLGKPMGVLILVLDALKGVAAAGLMPFLLAIWIEHLPLGASAERVYGLLGPGGTGLCMGIAAFLGHCYTPFLRFKGGKGVATALGVYLVVAPKALVLTLVVCLALMAATRLVSLASITGAVLLPVAILLFYWDDRPWARFGVTAVLGAIVVFRHRGNIRRLLAGSERGHSPHPAPPEAGQ